MHQFANIQDGSFLFIVFIWHLLAGHLYRLNVKTVWHLRTMDVVQCHATTWSTSDCHPPRSTHGPHGTPDMVFWICTASLSFTVWYCDTFLDGLIYRMTQTGLLQQLYVHPSSVSPWSFFRFVFVLFLNDWHGMGNYGHWLRRSEHGMDRWWQVGHIWPERKGQRQGMTVDCSGSAGNMATKHEAWTFQMFIITNTGEDQDQNRLKYSWILVKTCPCSSFFLGQASQNWNVM